MRLVLGVVLAGLVVSGCVYKSPWILGRAGTPRGPFDDLSCTELEDMLAKAKAREKTVKTLPRHLRRDDELAILESSIAALDEAIAANCF